MTEQEIGGNLEEMYVRAHEEKIRADEEKIKKEVEENKIKDLILLKNEIIMELDNKYHFDLMCLSIENLNDILPSLINYINDPNPEEKESLLKKATEFLKCLRDG
jgi:hypothetical protein